MTGSALSLYLEETKVNEDSMFLSEISPVKSEDVPECKIQGDLTLLAGARDNPSQGKREPCDVLLANTLALHKVLVVRNRDQDQKKCCVVTKMRFKRNTKKEILKHIQYKTDVF